MRRWFLAFIVIVLCAPFAKAQFTTVVATVKDANGTIYSGCRGDAVFVPNPAGATQPLLGGISVFPTDVIITQCDSGGNFTLSLADVAQVIPNGGTWKFNLQDSSGKFGFNYTAPICPNAGCITGNTVNISSGVQAAAAILPVVAVSGCVTSGTTALQKASGGGACSASALSDDGTNVTSAEPLLHNGNSRFKGPNPYNDVTAFGGRAALTFSGIVGPGTTATCSSGQPGVTISAANFVNGDGVLIYNCGAAHSMATPGAPTVTPSVPIAGANTNLVANSPAGSTTYNYQIVARNAAQGLTAASATGTTTTGQASLGTQQVNLQSCSRSSLTVTCTTLTYTLSAAANASGGNTVYTGTISPLPNAGTLVGVVVSGFTNGANNGTFQFVSATGTTLTLANASGVAETHAATAQFTHTLAVGAVISMSGTLDDRGGGSFSGWYQVKTVPNTTQFTIHTGNDTANGASASSTGGAVTWWNINHLTFAAVTGATQYCAYRGSTLIGCTPIAAGPNTFLYLDDFGATMTGTSLPYFIPPTPPVSATNNSLSTTVVSGGGTTSLTLAASAGNSVSGQTILLDTVPAINAALAAGGGVYIPTPNAASTVFPIQSQISLTNDAIAVFGPLLLNDTVILNNNNVWTGKVFPYGTSFSSFSYDTGAGITVSHAYPGIFIANGGTVIDHFNMTYPANGIGIELYGTNTSLLDMQITTGNDYIGNAIYMPGSFGANPFSIYFRRLLLASSQGIVTPGAILYAANVGQMKIDTLQLSGRGIMGAFVDLDLNGGRIQAGSNPVLTEIGGGTVRMHHYEQDTMANPLYTQIYSTAGFIPNVPNTIYLDDVGNPSFDGTATPPLVSGDVSLTSIIATGGTAVTGANEYVTQNVGPGGTGLYATGVNSPGTFAGNQKIAGGIQAAGGAAVGYAMPFPAVTVNVGGHGSCVSNCVGAGTFNYQISAIDADGRETGIANAPKNNVTVDGTQTVQVCWTPVQGQVGQRRFRGGVSDTAPGTSFGPGVANCYTDGTIAFSNSGANGSANGAYLSSNGVVGQQLILADQTDSGFTVTTKTATLTANRTQTQQDVSGPQTVTIASGTATMTTALIASQACGTVVTVSASGVLTTDSIFAEDNAQPAAATNGVLTIKSWPTANNVNFFYCNPTAAGVTPAAATLNWRVTR